MPRMLTALLIIACTLASSGQEPGGAVHHSFSVRHSVSQKEATTAADARRCEHVGANGQHVRFGF